VTSGQGGVGKSTLSLNLALELSRRGQRVCLLDADANLANITIMTGLAPEKTLADWLSGRASLRQLLLKGPEGLHIVPAASGLIERDGLDAAGLRRLIELLQRLERDFDFLVIDTAAGASRRLRSFLQAASELLIVVTTEPASLSAAFSLLKLLYRDGYRRPVRLVINRVPDFERARDALLRFSAAVRKYVGLRVIAPGYVFEDPMVTEALNRQKPLLELFPGCRAGRCLRNFTDRLLQGDDRPERRLSAWLEAQAGPDGDPLRRLIEDPDADWIDKVVERIREEPLEDVRLWMQLFSVTWQKRLREEGVATGEERRRQGFLAAVRLASRLGQDGATTESDAVEELA